MNSRDFHFSSFISRLSSFSASFLLINFNLVTGAAAGPSSANDTCKSLTVSATGELEETLQSCGTKLSAVCHRTNVPTFPSLADFVQIQTEQDGIRFEKFLDVPGWKVDYKVDMWPGNSLHRK